MSSKSEPVIETSSLPRYIMPREEVEQETSSKHAHIYNLMKEVSFRGQSVASRLPPFAPHSPDDKQAEHQHHRHACHLQQQDDPAAASAALRFVRNTATTVGP
ncbi:hypothetical protein ACM9HO_01245 [Pseudomonas sp. KHB2.9]